MESCGDCGCLSTCLLAGTVYQSRIASRWAGSVEHGLGDDNHTRAWTVHPLLNLLAVASDLFTTLIALEVPSTCVRQCRTIPDFSLPLSDFHCQRNERSTSNCFNSRVKTVIENAIQSCLNVATLSLESKAKARVVRARTRLANGGHLSGMEGALTSGEWLEFSRFRLCHFLSLPLLSHLGISRRMLHEFAYRHASRVMDIWSGLPGRLQPFQYPSLGGVLLRVRRCFLLAARPVYNHH